MEQLDNIYIKTIVLIAPGYMPLPAPGWGAVERIVWDYYEYLKQKNYNVLIINKSNHKLILEDYNKIVPEPDVVHIMYDDHIPVAPYLKCKKIVYTSHYAYITHPEFESKYHWYFNTIFKKVIDSKDHIYINAISDDIKNIYVKYGFPEDRINVIHNGAREDLFEYTLTPSKSNKSIYLAKIEYRKGQYKYQHIPNIDFVGNYHDSPFNRNRQDTNYLGEWTKDQIYKHMSDYGNLILLSDGEADPLVIKEALMAGLGVVLSECSSANLDLSKEYITVIPNNKLEDLDYVENAIIKNREKSITMRKEIREYALTTFGWTKIIDRYCKMCIHTKKVLHISHHVGCMRDHAYIYDQLHFKYTFWKFPKNVFNISKNLANEFWNTKKDYFNTFDYIVTSDTAPLSRIFMENINEVKPIIVIWICNRFDYNMENDSSFYDIFKHISNHHKDKFKIIPYSDFEGIWCNTKGITNLLPTITPIGINKIELDSKIDCLNELKNNYIKDNNSKEKYNNINEINGKIFIPIYGNDNHFFHLKNILEDAKIECFNSGYEHPNHLKECKAMITFPDAFSKLITFETIQNEVVVFLPSEEFIINLHPQTNNNTSYWFNNPYGKLNLDIIKYCEWYRYKECRIYFDSIDDLIIKIKNLTPEIIQAKKNWCKIYREEIKNKNLKLWQYIFIN